MIDALYIGATGMQAQQLNVDTIAQNLANVGTTGYKRNSVSFTDLIAREATPLARSSDAAIAGPLAALPHLGSGVAVGHMAKVFEGGDMKKTGSPLDIAIQGEGFLSVTLPDGSEAFARGGTLKVNSDGQLATSSGYALRPGITIPDNVQAIAIAADGTVNLTVPGQSTPIEAGHLEFVRFTDAGSLTALGENTYRANDASGAAIQVTPGQNGVGTLQQGFLEGSNVKLVDETVGLMVAQRAYEASVKVVQAADEMLGMVNNLRR
ncbi:flagellar basal-body rod protein FlgG [Pandoraea bronchicola]|uniref:Flagellar basal-body rod protein FlgG n=1 Tax=Pandoraea bronchicola TaxID=2508287 RepID=A0A5E5BZB9_9BURK|nr:flagellar basal-body rod protein FlgG [Pandoraea bronchicola]VVE90686.1 flagellar basal body rod protein FlgG [Pandoraea bronchicola]